MSNKWIDNEIDSFVKTKIDTIEAKKNIIEPEELDKIAPLARAHFKEQMKKESPLEREFYPYQNGIITLIASFPAKEWETVIIKNKKGETLRTEKRPKDLFKKSRFSFQGFCKILLKEASGNMFLSEEDSKILGSNQKAWMYGTILTQFDIKGKERGYYPSIEKACEKNNIDMNADTFSIDDVDISYKVNLWQIIAKVN